MQLNIYISGKISGEDPETCKAKFAAMETRLKNLGVDTVINPMNLGIPFTWPWEKAMELCMKVLKDKANTILMLNDWSSSEGAMVELNYARNHCYRIFTEDEADDIVFLVKHSGKWINTSGYEFP